MRLLKHAYILALIPILLVVGCKKDKEPTILAPVVSASTPLSNAVDVPVDATIEITFNKEMKASTLNTNSFTLFQGASQVTGAVTYANSKAVFTPTNDLAPNKVFDVTVLESVNDMDGNKLEKDYTFSFTTGQAPDITVPTITLMDPLKDAIDVAVDQIVSVTFSKEMDAATLNATSFTLKQGTNSISGTVAYAASIATFTPTSNLGTGLVYTATVTTSAMSASGIALAADKVWSFTTDALPTVISTDPLNNATEVVRNKAISVTFSEAMDITTLTTTTFMVKQGANVVTGTIEISDNTARFIPSVSLAASLIYTATVTNAVKDMAGNSMSEAKVWSFSTGTISGIPVVNLRAAGDYVILAKTAINNIPTSAITGDMGLSPAATSYITGFGLTDATGYATSPQVTGSVFAADMASPTGSNLTTAVENMLTAYTDAAGRPTPDYLNLLSGNIGGQTLEAGLYKWGTTVTIPGDVTLSGSADDIWIFQIDNDLTMSANKNILLSGGAQAKNIFWQVAGEAVIGANSHFEGIILSMTGITLETNASFHGRMLAQSAVILDQNAVTNP